jgi:hypothetical protein
MKFYSVLLLILLSPIMMISSHGFAAKMPSNSMALTVEQENASSLSSNVAEKVRSICIYSVSNGRLKPLIFTEREIQERGYLNVEGYVCGVVLLGEDGVTASIDNQKMSQIKRNSDGSFTLKYFGRSKLEELHLDDELHFRYGKDKEGKTFLAGGYSFFPPIAGDAISLKENFSINLESEEGAIEIPVQQNAYNGTRTVCLSSDCETDRLLFRFVGVKPEDVSDQSAELEGKLRVIAEGIHSIESAIGMDLVNHINVIDYEGVSNAVTCEEGADVWFYAQALRKQPVEELRTIAAHEALHKLVARKGLTGSPEIRELFADLRGYDELSLERFTIVMTGDVPPAENGANGVNSALFAFINEKNFLEGMKGGHSQTNLDEFCTSFLHSLLFIDRLEQNIHNPVALPGGTDQPQHLSAQEKSLMLDNYKKTLEIMIRVVSRQGKKGSEPSTERTLTLLENGLREVKRVKENNGLVGA